MESNKPKLGVEPTKAWITLSNSKPQEILRVKIYNPSTTPANYTFIITDDMKDYVSWECTNPIYWCVDNSYIVPAGLNRSDAMIVDMLFMKKTDIVGAKNFTITVRAEPISNKTGTVGIVPQVTIDIYLNQVYISTTTSTTVSTTTTITVPTTTTQYSSSNNPTTTSSATSTTVFDWKKWVGWDKTTTTSTTSTVVSPRDVIVSGSTTVPQQKQGFVWDFWSYLLVAVVIVMFAFVGVFGYLKYIYG